MYIAWGRKQPLFVISLDYTIFGTHAELIKSSTPVCPLRNSTGELALKQTRPDTLLVSPRLLSNDVTYSQLRRAQRRRQRQRCSGSMGIRLRRRESGVWEEV